MLRHKIIFVTLFSCFLAVNISTVLAMPVDSGTHWLIVDATPDAQADPLLTRLSEVLVERGKVPRAQIHHLKGEQATREEIHAVFTDIRNASVEKQSVIFLYHGPVTKPRGRNVMHLLVQGETPIEDYTLNQWFQQIGARQTPVIIDAYTSDDNLTAYYANRETLGTAALNIIKTAATAGATDKNSILQQIITAFTDQKTDQDANRRLSILEIYEALPARRDFRGGILAPTGDVEQDILKLSPALKVTTSPEGAQILLNGEESGLTPKLFTDNLQQETYTVAVRKPGYTSPPPKTTELKRTQGEAVEFTWTLKPITVSGTVTGPTGESVVGAQVSIEGTDYVERVDEDSTYTFETWKPAAPLTPGTDYTLNVKHEDLYYGSATFTFGGYTAIEQPIRLEKKTWFEVAELEFSRENHAAAIAAFQNGIEVTLDFPPLSEDLTLLLLSSFADAIKRSEVKDVNYIVVTAKLAEAYQKPELAKTYWEQVKLKAEKGSPAAKLAGQRLWQRNPWRHVVNIGAVVLLVAALISGTWTYYRYRKSKQTDTESEADTV